MYLCCVTSADSTMPAQPGTPKGHAAQWAWQASLRDVPDATAAASKRVAHAGAKALGAHRKRQALPSQAQGRQDPGRKVPALPGLRGSMPSARGLEAAKEALPTQRGREQGQQHNLNGGQASRHLNFAPDAMRLADTGREVAGGNLQASVFGLHSLAKVTFSTCSMASCSFASPAPLSPVPAIPVSICWVDFCIFPSGILPGQNLST